MSYVYHTMYIAMNSPKEYLPNYVVYSVYVAIIAEQIW